MKHLCIMTLTLATSLLFSPLMVKAEPQTNFGIKDLKDLILKNNIKSIDDLLGQLRLDTPEILESYSLVFSSRSLQTASEQHPRVIVFGKNPANPYDSDQNNFIFAFSGDPSSPRKNIIELMEFDPLTNDVHFAEIAFSRKRASRLILAR